MTNDLAKLENEYNSILQEKARVWLRIRFTTGMETLIDEIDKTHINSAQLPTYDWSPNAPESPKPWEPVSPVGPTKQASKRFFIDASGSFPSLFIPEEKVSFYSNMQEFKQAIADQQEGEIDKIILNIANIISVEKIIVRRVYDQNIRFADVKNGIRFEEPDNTKLLEITFPDTIPFITDPNQEMLIHVGVKNGIAPYRYSILNQPSDLYITEDGWIRGFIEVNEWPLEGSKDYFLVVVVEDSSLPPQKVGIEYRFRLNAIAV